MKKIEITSVSEEWRAGWLLDKTYWFPSGIAINWPEILSA